MANRLGRALSSAVVSCVIAATGRAEPLSGGELYRDNCASCHGSDGRGDGPDAALLLTAPRNLRDGILNSHSTAEIEARVLDGRRKALELDLTALRAHAADTDAVVTYLQRLPAVEWKAADPGRTLFNERCAPCHGSFGHPPVVLPPGVRPPRELADPAFQRATAEPDMVIAVRHGRAAMPALTPRLTEEQARQVAAFVRLLSPGYATYTQYCAPCHGDHGIGAGSFAESVPAPTVSFDRAYFARHDTEQIQRSVWHMLESHRPAMPHFRGTLSEADVRAIIGYLRAQGR